MMTGSIVATKKGEGEQEGRPSSRSDYIRVRMSEDFKRWFEGLATHDAERRRSKASLSDTIDQALVAYAKRIGYGEPPPAR